MRFKENRRVRIALTGDPTRRAGDEFRSGPAFNVFGADGRASEGWGQSGATQDFFATQDALEGGDAHEGVAGPAPEGGGFECDASDIEGMSSGSHAPDEEHAEAEVDAEEEELLSTPQRLGKIRDIALGILAGQGVAAAGSGRGVDARDIGEMDASRGGGDDAPAQRVKGGDGGGSFEDVDAEEARLWVEEAHVGAAEVIARVLESIIAATEEGLAEQRAVMVAAGVERRNAGRERRLQAAEKMHAAELQQANEEHERACRAARDRAHALLFSHQHHRQEMQPREEEERSRNSSVDSILQVRGQVFARPEPAAPSDASLVSECSEEGGTRTSIQGGERHGWKEDGANGCLANGSMPLLVPSARERQRERARDSDPEVNGSMARSSGSEGSRSQGSRTLDEGEVDTGSCASLTGHARAKEGQRPPVVQEEQEVEPFGVRVCDLQLRGGGVTATQQMQQNQKMQMQGGSVEYKVKLSFQGSKARSPPSPLLPTRSTAHPLLVKWPDAFDFLAQGVGAIPSAGGAGRRIAVKVVKLQRSSCGAYPVESVEGLCEVAVQVPRHGQRGTR